MISRWVSRIATRGPPLRVPRGRGVPTETSTEGFVPNVVLSQSGVRLARRRDEEAANRKPEKHARCTGAPDDSEKSRDLQAARAKHHGPDDGKPIT